MNFRPLQLTLRELRTVYADPRAVLAMGTVGAIAGLAGPFSTFQALDLPQRLFYWVALVFASYAAGLCGAVLLGEWLAPRRKPLALRITVSALGAAVPAWAVVVLFNLVFFPQSRGTGWEMGWLFVYVLLICLALMTLIDGVIVPMLAGSAPDTAAADPPPLLARLPHEIRGPISHLSMADHYVEVTTQKGSALVLLRLADAIAETRGIDGLQIHRSHWVARDAVKALRRIEGKVMVETRTGALLPVSRTHLAPVRASFGPA